MEMVHSEFKLIFIYLSTILVLLLNVSNYNFFFLKNCLGALDGTYINVRVPEEDKPRYRSRKGDIDINCLGVCDRDMGFVFIFPGWEGSTADGRVLRDEISKPNGLKIPIDK